MNDLINISEMSVEEYAEGLLKANEAFDEFLSDLESLADSF